MSVQATTMARVFRAVPLGQPADRRKLKRWVNTTGRLYRQTRATGALAEYGPFEFRRRVRVVVQRWAVAANRKAA